MIKKIHSPQIIGMILILMSSTFFGVMGPLAQVAKLEGMPQSSILTYRFLISFVLLAIWSARKQKISGLKIKTLLTPFLMGLIGYFILAHSYFSAIDYIGAGMTSILLYTYPSIIVAYQLLKKHETLNLRLLLALGLAFSGVVLSLPSLDLNFEKNFGILLGLCASIAYAIYLLVGNYTLRKISPYIVSTMVCLGSSISFFMEALIFDELVPIPSLKSAVCILGLALFSTVLAILFLFKGMELVRVSHASILSAFEPVIAVSAGILLLNETLQQHQVAGFILILLSIIAVTFKPRAKLGIHSKSPT